MAAPTKNSIIGQFVNGRNAQDDFLQLADNHGGTVFGWIDYLGHLNGSLLSGTGTPGGSNTDIQFNNSGVLDGDSGFTYNPSTGAVLIDPLAPVLTSIAPFTISANGGGFTPLVELMGAGTGSGNGPFMFFTPTSGAGNTGSSRGTVLFAGIDQTGGMDFTVTQNTRDAGGMTLQGSAGAVPGALEVGVWGIIDPNNHLTELFFTPDGGIDFYISNLTPSIHIDASANTTWLNPIAATSLANQSSPILSIQGNYWTGSITAIDHWTIQNVLATGINPASTLTFAHTGGGAASVSFGGATVSTGNIVVNQIDATGIINLDSAAATSLANINSFPVNWNGHYWTGSVSAADTWSATNILGTGANPTTTLTFAHSGSTGALAVSIPTLIESVTHTPSSASDTGTTGQIAWDSGFIYVCIAPNSWKRVAIAAGF